MHLDVRCLAIRAVAPAIAAILMLSGCAGDDRGSSPRATASPSPTATTPTDGEEPEENVATIAAVDADGRVVILDGDSGDVRRVLLEGIQVRDPASNAVAVTPDRTAVLVVRPGTSAEEASDIVRLSASGGDEEILAQGGSPAVSPDGKTLAYVRLVPADGAAAPAPTIRLHDLGTGEERELRTTQKNFYGIWELAWTGDGDRLAFVAGEVQTAVYVVDADARSLDEARHLGPQDKGATWTDVAVLEDGQLAVIERCCQLPDPDPERWHVISVDADTGAVGDDVFGPRTEAALIDARTDAEGLLVVEGGGPGGGRLLRSEGSGDLRALADDIIVAAW